MERTKNWLKDNLLLLVITALIGGFWTQYQMDRQHQDTINDKQDVEIQDLKVITYNLARVQEATSDQLDMYDKRFDRYDEQFMEIYKMLPRGGATKK